VESEGIESVLLHSSEIVQISSDIMSSFTMYVPRAVRGDGRDPS
jgi:hypothetical protein